jgi:EpsI family protein
VSTPWLVLTVALLLAPMLFWLRPAPSSIMPVLALPDLAGWQGPMEAASGWSPKFDQADVVSHSAYERDGKRVEVYVNWYASQTQGREVVGYGNRVEGGWAARQLGVRKLELDRGAVPGVQEIMIASRNGTRRLVWYWYQIGDRAETSRVRAKLVGGWQALQGQRGAGLIAVSAACESDCEAAREALNGLLQNAGAPIRDTLLAAADTAAKE